MAFVAIRMIVSWCCLLMDQDCLMKELDRER